MSQTCLFFTPRLTKRSNLMCVFFQSGGQNPSNRTSRGHIQDPDAQMLHVWKNCWGNKNGGYDMYFTAIEFVGTVAKVVTPLVFFHGKRIVRRYLGKVQHG